MLVPLTLPRYWLVVYVLRDPPGRVRYVGMRGGKLSSILRQHVNAGRRVLAGRVKDPTPVDAWVAELLESGRSPTAGAIDHCARFGGWNGGHSIGAWWVHEYRRREPDLLNRTFYRKNLRNLGRFATLLASGG